MENTLSDIELAKLPSSDEKSLLSKIEAGSLSMFLGAPILADVDRLVTSEDWADGALTIAAQPDVPRNVTATLTDADDSVSGVLTIIGTDIFGNAVTETMTVAVGTGKVFVGTKIFASITSATVSGTSGAAGGTDTVTVGVGTVIGLPTVIDAAAAILHTYLGGTRIAAPVITTGENSSIDASAGTYDGSKILHAFVAPAKIS